MTDLTYSPAAVSRLLTAVLHPETVEGWQEPQTVADRLDEIAAAFVTADPQTRDGLIAEAAELLTLDPRTADEIDMDEFTKEVNETRKSDYPY